MENLPVHKAPGAARRSRMHEQDWLLATAFFRQIEALLGKVAERPRSGLLVESYFAPSAARRPTRPAG